MNPQDDFLGAFAKLKESQQRTQYLRQSLGDFMAGNLTEEELKARIYNGPPPPGSNPVPPKKWGSLAEMNAALAKLPKQPTPPKINPEVRKRQIEQELDIIRGITPTPKGYKVDPGKVKALMAELKQLG